MVHFSSGPDPHRFRRTAAERSRRDAEGGEAAVVEAPAVFEGKATSALCSEPRWRYGLPVSPHRITVSDKKVGVLCVFEAE